MTKAKKLTGTPSEGDVERMVAEFGEQSVICYLLISGWDIQRRAELVREDLKGQWLFTAAWLFAQAKVLEERLRGGPGGG